MPRSQENERKQDTQKLENEKTKNSRWSAELPPLAHTAYRLYLSILTRQRTKTDATMREQNKNKKNIKKSSGELFYHAAHFTG